ncbi:uncharacterized protein FFB20_04961 [Fusarium fujikuroi]|uniref:Uncharacterized protein n=1 Tax=Fusarium fujikuroi TaxID=5127 RepID=A0A2H3RWW0_FUSFU|nr:uncharacterized protein FFB20_04961 [Fusarium fujikuroi]SCO01477.1 uncharacterized protein FFC1_08922 [Fusarium fujikuroi]SCO06095.1 uncharacterized protein FFE2_10954 [Fusarium fujikuroi]SCO47115.1 uncharacterized protein FFNC_11181 [Fusarium fujikuroi]SCV52533.1 uncharacterized protein FFFS_10347 [Fusarium fujikuroi]
MSRIVVKWNQHYYNMELYPIHPSVAILLVAAALCMSKPEVQRWAIVLIRALMENDEARRIIFDSFVGNAT